MRQMKDINDQLVRQVDDLQRKLAATDPDTINDQKEMINDLKNKVSILERELQLVHENFEHEIEQYKLNGGIQKKKRGTNPEDLDEITQNMLKQELVKARSELE